MNIPDHQPVNPSSAPLAPQENKAKGIAWRGGVRFFAQLRASGVLRARQMLGLASKVRDYVCVLSTCARRLIQKSEPEPVLPRIPAKLRITDPETFKLLSQASDAGVDISRVEVSGAINEFDTARSLARIFHEIAHKGRPLPLLPNLTVNLCLDFKKNEINPDKKDETTPADPTEEAFEVMGAIALFQRLGAHTTLTAPAAGETTAGS